MAIDRERVDLRRFDYSNVASGRLLPPVHPGAILRDEFVQPMQLGVHRLARGLEVSRPRLNEIAFGRRAATTDTALRLALYFGATPEFRINLETRYDLDVAERAVRHTIDRGGGATCGTTSSYQEALEQTAQQHKKVQLILSVAPECVGPAGFAF